MFCGQCGAQNDGKSQYCGRCGAKLEPIESQSPKEKDSAKSSTSDILKTEKANLTAPKNKLVLSLIIAMTSVIVLVIVVIRNSGNPLIGTWEERSFTTPYGTSSYEAGIGDKIILGNDNKIIDADLFLGQEFGYAVPVDILSWKVEDDVLIFYTRYNEVEYVPYTLRGKNLTLHFSDERSAELHKIK